MAFTGVRPRAEPPRSGWLNGSRQCNLDNVAIKGFFALVQKNILDSRWWVIRE